jgi:Flp pilus assembly pilin Flp
MHFIHAAQIRMRKLSRDTKGQDMIEYALLAAFVAVTYGAFWGPSYSFQLARIWNRVSLEITRLTGV